MKKWLIIFGFFILYSNDYSLFIKIFFEGIFEHFPVETMDCRYQFDMIPSKGRDKDMLIRSYNAYLEENNLDEEDHKLYRVYSRNPFKFWRWREYFIWDVYDFPYKEPCEE